MQRALERRSASLAGPTVAHPSTSPLQLRHSCLPCVCVCVCPLSTPAAASASHVAASPGPVVKREGRRNRLRLFLSFFLFFHYRGGGYADQW